MNPARLNIIKTGKDKKGPVIYWMQRDQRVNDNWALLHAQEQALRKGAPLYVLFCLVPKFLDATLRQYDFMLKGLEEVESNLSDVNIPFFIKLGTPKYVIPQFINSTMTSLLVTDFNPLKTVRLWKRDIEKVIDISFHEVDAHNVVPCTHVSDKEEFAAYTLRPKINKLLDTYLDKYPRVKKMNSPFSQMHSIDWPGLYKSLEIDFKVKEIDWLKPGEKNAHKELKKFIDRKLPGYAEQRNDPNADAQSNMSPYLHFGQISAQRIALSIQPVIDYPESQKAFLEELIVRRELADNFCYYNYNYDSFQGFHNWAKTSLNLHRKDKREIIYSTEEFELAKTNDRLWNAAQQQMVKTGKMHGYMRMYWAKKIFEWTQSPEEAMKIAIYLNDKYQLDGRDPNGYAGIAWSIGGVHDRAWGERPVFGKIRYMNFNGCKRKFDVYKYIDTYLADDPTLNFEF